MRLPDFLIIGSAKSATTTLYEYLCRHPQIYMSTPKEPEFFARDEKYSRGIDWYASLFSSAQPERICGEASTIYTRWPQFPKSAERIYRAVPDVKMIYIMRHPVDRAYSHYAQRIKTAQNTKVQLKVEKTFEEKIKSDPFLLDSSNYMNQIEQYLKFFPKESLLFLLMDDLLNNTAQILSEICRFIGVDDEIDLIHKAPVSANTSRHHAEWFLRSRITAPLKKIPGILFIANSLPQETRDKTYELLKKLPYTKSVERQYLPQPMLAETREMLLEKFREPNQRLSNFLNRDLSHWSK